MSLPILFRSHISPRSRSGTSARMMRTRGSDWSHLRNYTEHDDIRDIVWKKIKPEGFALRIRESQSEYHVISYLERGVYDDARIDTEAHTRGEIVDMIEYSVERSTRALGYRYDNYDSLSRLIKQKPQNTILIISGNIDEAIYRQLAYHNDLIYLDIVHPYESDPRGDILFSGKILDISSYGEEYRETKYKLNKTLRDIGASYVPCITTQDITHTLNTFFKNRYHHG